MGVLIIIAVLLTILIIGTVIFLLFDIRGYLSTIVDELNIIKCESKITNINLDCLTKLKELELKNAEKFTNQ